VFFVGYFLSRNTFIGILIPFFYAFFIYYSLVFFDKYYQNYTIFAFAIFANFSSLFFSIRDTRFSREFLKIPLKKLLIGFFATVFMSSVTFISLTGLLGATPEESERTAGIVLFLMFATDFVLQIRILLLKRKLIDG